MNPMHKNPLNLAVFLVGLVAIGWIGAGYATTNPVAALVAAFIGACYLAGVAELWRYQRATAEAPSAALSYTQM